MQRLIFVSRRRPTYPVKQPHIRWYLASSITLHVSTSLRMRAPGMHVVAMSTLVLFRYYRHFTFSLFRLPNKASSSTSARGQVPKLSEMPHLTTGAVSWSIYLLNCVIPTEIEERWQDSHLRPRHFGCITVLQSRDALATF